MKTNRRPRFCQIGCLLVACVLLTACIPSLQPFYREKDLIMDGALVGSFSEKEDSPVWTFGKDGERQYRLTITDHEKKSKFVAHFFQLENDRFLDLYPSDDGLDDCPREDFFRASLIPGHLLVRVPQLGEHLTLQIMDEDGIKQLLSDAKVNVAHSFIQDKRLVLTATTEQLQGFLRSIWGEAKAWGEPSEFRRRK